MKTRRAIVPVLIFSLAGCMSAGPKLSELNCPAIKVLCSASIEADTGGVWIATDTSECAQVHRGADAPLAVCNGRRWLAGPEEKLAFEVTGCEICPRIKG